MTGLIAFNMLLYHGKDIRNSKGFYPGLITLSQGLIIPGVTLFGWIKIGDNGQLIYRAMAIVSFFINILSFPYIFLTEFYKSNKRSDP